MSVRCSCGKHDLDGDGLDPCHFCGHPTSMRPYIDWELGRLYHAICHRCSADEGIVFDRWYVAVWLAPESEIARAHAFGAPAAGIAQA